MRVKDVLNDGAFLFLLRLRSLKLEARGLRCAWVGSPENTINPESPAMNAAESGGADDREAQG